MSKHLDPKFINEILLGDCVELMAELPDECQVCSLYSPPYDAIRKYGGHRFDFERFARELYRVTAQGGVAISVIQDQVINGSFTGTKYKQAVHFMDLGFNLLNELTLEVENAHLPQRIRYTPNSHTAFVFSKGRPRVVNLLRDKPNRSAGLFKKDWHSRSEDGTMRSGCYGKRVAPFGLRSDVWRYLGGRPTKDDIDHPAPMIEAMAEDLILSYSRPGDMVFDPLCGAGTSLKMALLNHRLYLGCEIHEPYWKEAIKRLAKAEEEYKKRLDDELNIKIVVPSIAKPQHNFDVPSIIFPSKAKVSIKQADVLSVLRGLDDNSFDGGFGDPPYGLRFMGKEWDGALPSVEVWQGLLRVVKPGAMFFAFGHPRTEHRLKVNIEDSGWIIRDTMMWLHGTGLPKSQDISKAIDCALGAERKKVRWPPRAGGSYGGSVDPRPWAERSRQNGFHEADGPIPVTSEAARWLGYGTALKPAWEAIVVAMKPCEGSFAQNALDWGVAGLNIDDSRVGQDEITLNRCKDGWKGFGNGAGHPYEAHRSVGRFPANIILDEEAGRLLDVQGPVSNGSKYRKSGRRDIQHKGKLLYGGGIGGGAQNAPDTYGDAGGPSRLFYCPKANKQERNAGCDGLPIKRPDERSEAAMGMWDKHGIQPQQNHHPAVKPIALCKYLANLILPPKRDTPRKLIVPYAGSGSEMIGSVQAGWDEVLGVEIDPEFVEIAQRRIAHWIGGAQ